MACISLQCRNNILRRRLEQCDDIADKLLLRLDVTQSVQLIVAHVNASLGESRFQNGFVGLLAEFLDQDRRSLRNVGEHNRGRTLQYFYQISVSLLHLLQRLAQQRVLHDYQFDVVFEALAAQGSGLLCVKRRDVGDIEVRISLELLGNGVNNDQFFFLCHLFSPPSYLVSTDLESICKPGLIVVER